MRLNVDDAPAEIYLKLETLQPIGSFKLRGAVNAMRSAAPEELGNGVWTASTGNMAQGVAWGARELGVKCTVVVLDNSSVSKLNAIRGLGAGIKEIPRVDWFDLILSGNPQEAMEGLYISPFNNRAVIAGQGTIGVEIVEDLPDVDAVITPFGGGGLTAGVASAVRILKPDTRLYACELETGAPLAPSLAAGRPVTIEPPARTQLRPGVQRRSIRGCNDVAPVEQSAGRIAADVGRRSGCHHKAAGGEQSHRRRGRGALRRWPRRWQARRERAR